MPRQPERHYTSCDYFVDAATFVLRLFRYDIIALTIRLYL